MPPEPLIRHMHAWPIIPIQLFGRENSHPWLTKPSSVVLMISSVNGIFLDRTSSTCTQRDLGTVLLLNYRDLSNAFSFCLDPNHYRVCFGFVERLCICNHPIADIDEVFWFRFFSIASVSLPKRLNACHRHAFEGRNSRNRCNAQGKIPPPPTPKQITGEPKRSFRTNSSLQDIY